MEHLPQYKRDPYSSFLGSELLRFPVFSPLPATAPFSVKDQFFVLLPELKAESENPPITYASAFARFAANPLEKPENWVKL